MFRKQGFMNTFQILDFSIEKAKLNFPILDNESQTEVFTKTRRFSALYTYRYLMEGAEAFLLFHPLKGVAEVEAEHLLGYGPTLLDHSVDKTLDSLLQTSEGITKAISVIQPKWPFISNNGLVSAQNSGWLDFVFGTRTRNEKSEVEFFLRPFNGFAVLVSVDSVNAAWRPIAEEFENTRVSGDEEDGSEKVTYEETLNCLLKAFPHGKGGATWRQVEKSVGYSRRTIVRAIKLADGHKDWASRGQLD